MAGSPSSVMTDMMKLQLDPRRGQSYCIHCSWIAEVIQSPFLVILQNDSQVLARFMSLHYCAELVLGLICNLGQGTRTNFIRVPVLRNLRRNQK